MVAPRYGFEIYNDPAAGRRRLIGNPDIDFAGEYTSRSGKNIPDALSKVVATLSIGDLDLLRLINRAYQLELWDEFKDLLEKAEKVLSKKENKTLSVFDKVPT